MVKDAVRQTMKRRSDEPKLEIGDKLSIKQGAVAVVLARYTPSGGRNEVCYIVEILSDAGDKKATDTSSTR